MTVYLLVMSIIVSRLGSNLKYSFNTKFHQAMYELVVLCRKIKCNRIYCMCVCVFVEGCGSVCGWVGGWVLVNIYIYIYIYIYISYI